MVMYITLLLCGLFLIGAEIFVPGGVLGAFGAAALIGAAVLGFTLFPPWAGVLSLLFILSLTGLALFIWMKYLPRSRIGKAFMLAETIQSAPAENPLWSVGMTGTSLCELRPAGNAVLDGRRADVIADKGMWIARDIPVEIVRIEGSRIYVLEIKR